MERKLIDYLPYVVRDYAEFQGITGAEQPEFENAWAAVDDLLDNQFITTAGNLGLSRWEKIMKITPKETDTLDTRRVRIMAKLNEHLPYTIPMLKQQLLNLCGEDKYSVEINNYNLIVKTQLVEEELEMVVYDLLFRITPVNMMITLELMYCPHKVLNCYTHKHLADFTHEYIRNTDLRRSV